MSIHDDVAREARHDHHNDDEYRRLSDEQLDARKGDEGAGSYYYRPSNWVPFKELVDRLRGIERSEAA